MSDENEVENETPGTQSNPPAAFIKKVFGPDASTQPSLAKSQPGNGVELSEPPDAEFGDGPNGPGRADGDIRLDQGAPERDAGVLPPDPGKRESRTGKGMLDGPTRDRLASLSKRLRTAISAIAERSPSFAKTTLSRYLNFVGMARIDVTQLPVTVRPHPLNPERQQNPSDRWTLLYFHVGNAILGLRDAYQGRDLKVPEPRIKLLEEIAKIGPENFLVTGNDTPKAESKHNFAITQDEVGYTLVNAFTLSKLERPLAPDAD